MPRIPLKLFVVQVKFKPPHFAQLGDMEACLPRRTHVLQAQQIVHAVLAYGLIAYAKWHLSHFCGVNTATPVCTRTGGEERYVYAVHGLCTQDKLTKRLQTTASKPRRVESPGSVRRQDGPPNRPTDATLQDDGSLEDVLRRAERRRAAGTAERDNHCRLLKVTDAFNSEKRAPARVVESLFGVQRGTCGRHYCALSLLSTALPAALPASISPFSWSYVNVGRCPSLRALHSSRVGRRVNSIAIVVERVSVAFPLIDTGTVTPALPSLASEALTVIVTLLAGIPIGNGDGPPAVAGGGTWAVFMVGRFSVLRTTAQAYVSTADSIEVAGSLGGAQPTAITAGKKSPRRVVNMLASKPQSRGYNH